MAMNERIKKIRKEKHLTQQQFASALNISRNNIAGYETGTRTPSDAALNNICKTFFIVSLLNTHLFNADESIFLGKLPFSSVKVSS